MLQHSNKTLGKQHNVNIEKEPTLTEYKKKKNCND